MIQRQFRNSGGSISFGGCIVKGNGPLMPWMKLVTAEGVLHQIEQRGNCRQETFLGEETWPGDLQAGMQIEKGRNSIYCPENYAELRIIVIHRLSIRLTIYGVHATLGP